MKAYGQTHVGLVRSINEDSFYLPRPGETFAAVADGMGGHLAGEVASHIAVEEFTRWIRYAPFQNEETLRYAVTEANQCIYREAKRDLLKSGMGTTLTALWFDEEKHIVFLTHVGDSRAYLMRNGAMMQISKDHSLVEEMVEQGQITPEQALTHPQRNYITRALGTAPHVQPDIVWMPCLPGDVWLLCSDGLSNNIRSHEMAEVLTGKADWGEKVQSLIDLALQRGGRDNITAVLLVGEEAGE